jgi:Baseplate J-like protein
MNDQLYCADETRQARVRDGGVLNGIDFLEVLDSQAPIGSPRQRTLLVYCFLPVAGLDRANVRIEGGVRITAVNVTWAYPANAVPTTPTDPLNAAERQYLSQLPEPDRILVLRTDQTGDFSTYTLRLIFSDIRPNDPPARFDGPLSITNFSFKVDCPSDFDCASTQDCPQPHLPVPQINYLSKDYASFRRLLLDRLAVTMPDWQEQHAADLGTTLVELLAYAGDYLSYYQDAVATEAYLGTARSRVSVRRHARLVNYLLHDGANARAWIVLMVTPNSNADGATLRAGSKIGTNSSDPTSTATNAPVVFETMHDALLARQRNEIPFHTWGDNRCCLPVGATRATLKGSRADLALQEGGTLIFEEVRGPLSGLGVDADPTHRCVVRLASPPVENFDRLTGETVLLVEWYVEDALPFPLCLWELVDSATGAGVPVSVARGNVVLADHGLTTGEILPAVQTQDGRPYRPLLQGTGITQAAPFAVDRARTPSATSMLSPDVRQAMPSISLLAENGEVWLPQRDLLRSDRFALEFVVETESDGSSFLRFGDGTLGRQPATGQTFAARYRIGSGRVGNVGAEALTLLLPRNPADPAYAEQLIVIAGISQVRNPLPAVGGIDLEPIDQVRLYAPQAFRTQERAVTEEDYAAVAQRHPKVQRAAASRRWTGSWYTMFVTVDLLGGLGVDTAFKDELRAFLEAYRLAGFDVEIDAPRYVPLDIALSVCVAPGYYRSDVKKELLTAFSATNLPDGRRGFFHPDNFTFGQSVYLSQVVATAMAILGVSWVDTSDSPAGRNRFQRWGQAPAGELEAGRILFARLEIARVDNDPNEPENGRIDFSMQGGL